MSFRRCKAAAACALLFALAALAPLLLGSCSSKLSPEEKAEALEILRQRDYEKLRTFTQDPQVLAAAFGDDSAYFLALHYLEAGDTINARLLLEYGKKRGSAYAAKRCAQKLAEFGSDTERMEAAKAFYKAFPEEPEAVLCLAREHYKQKQYQKVLEVARLPPLEDFSAPPQEADAETDLQKRLLRRDLQAQNEIAKLRILSLVRLQDRSFVGYLSAWANYWVNSKAQAEFLDEWKELAPQATEKLSLAERSAVNEALAVLRFRAAVYAGRYAQACALASELPKQPESFAPLLLSDFGRAHLYGGTGAAEGCEIFRSAAEKARDSAAAFLAWFYCGRFYVAAKNYDAALNAYVLAMKSAASGANYDNALWYYLKCTLQVSTERAILALEAYAPTWKDAAYFEDFLQSLASKLLQAKRWGDFIRVYRLVAPYADGDSLAQYSYVSARLIQEGLAENPFDGKGAGEVAEELLRDAFERGHGALYYRLLAAYRLGVSDEAVEKAVRAQKGAVQFAPDANFEKFLCGYADFAFEDKIFDEYAAEYERVGTDCAVKLAQAVEGAGARDSKLYSQALRIVSYASRNAEVLPSRQSLECLYPRPFAEEIRAVCGEYSINEEIFYALVRTESFFNSAVVSSAGAVGLAQLMKSTADDIARRLRVEGFDLKDPATNLRFGAYYLDNLVGRLDGAVMLGLFSYNGGINRVRSWRRESGELPMDLFLELVPYAETCDYGRKVLAAAAMYGHLYYGKSFSRVVGEILGE